MSYASNRILAYAALRARQGPLTFFLALTIGLLISFIQWPDIIIEITGAPMWDRLVYAEKIHSGNTLLDYFYYDNIVSFFTFEFLWSNLLEFVSQSQYISVIIFFQIISTISISAFSIILAQRTHFLTPIFLMNPLVIDLCYSQLRLALALSLLMWLYILKIQAKYIIWPVLVATVMIHTALIVFILAHFVAIMTATEVPRQGFTFKKPMLLLVLFGFLIGVLVGPLRGEILTAVGDRRAEYPSAPSSFLYLSFWLVLFIVIVADKKHTLALYESRYAVIILGIVFVNAFTDFYSQRFLAATFPFLLVTIFRAFGRYNYLISMPFMVYFVFQWYYYSLN